MHAMVKVMRTAAKGKGGENKKSAGMSCHLAHAQKTCEVPTADGMAVSGLQNRMVYAD
jgi:hypothetical protein